MPAGETMKESATEIFFDDEDIINIREGKSPFLLVPTVEIEDGWIKHVNCEGARFHVLHWTSQGSHCSEPNCIINKPPDAAKEQKSSRRKVDSGFREYF
jgi:hypothetical protein